MLLVTEVLAFLGHSSICDVPIKNIRLDSRLVQPGDVFVAVPGLKSDGREYVTQAISNGAVAALVQAGDGTLKFSSNIPIVAINHLDTKFAAIAGFFYNYPSDALKVIAITGTNGKTSCSHYTAQLLTAAGSTCGVMGTLGNGLLPNLTPTSLTTADSFTLQQQLAEFVQQKVKYAAIEASSHALAQQRLQGISIDTAVFTNLSQDHLDYHADMSEYFAAKLQLFTTYKPKHCVINLDDPYSAELIAALPSSQHKITYSLNNPAADVFLQDDFLSSPWGSGQLKSPLLGKFNLSNLLACIATCAIQDVPLNALLSAAPNLVPVAGRMQKVSAAQNAPQVVIDYAHTPDALAKVLQTLRSITEAKLHCVFGCGGDRDRSKRPLMLNAAVQFSDQVIITQDNPRTEDPMQIVADMMDGESDHSKISIELDRARAIEQTVQYASAKDLILIAGKGHEDYQIIGTTKRQFSDLIAAQQALALRSKT